MYVFLRKTVFKKQRYVLIIFRAFTLVIWNQQLHNLRFVSITIILCLCYNEASCWGFVDMLHMSALLQEDNCLEENWVMPESFFHMVKYEGVQILKFPKMGLRGRTYLKTELVCKCQIWFVDCFSTFLFLFTSIVSQSKNNHRQHYVFSFSKVIFVADQHVIATY